MQRKQFVNKKGCETHLRRTYEMLQSVRLRFLFANQQAQAFFYQESREGVDRMEQKTGSVNRCMKGKGKTRREISRHIDSRRKDPEKERRSILMARFPKKKGAGQ